MTLSLKTESAERKIVGAEADYFQRINLRKIFYIYSEAVLSVSNMTRPFSIERRNVVLMVHLIPHFFGAKLYGFIFCKAKPMDNLIFYKCEQAHPR